MHPKQSAADEPEPHVKDELEFTASDFEVKAPAKIQESPVAKKSAIPGVQRKHPQLPPEADVLEQSLHVKFSFKDDDFVKGPGKSQPVNWYSDDAFEGLAEPDFSFELMMTGDQDDPVFCIDGDYYDSSGRLLVVKQGKGQVIKHCVKYMSVSFFHGGLPHEREVGASGVAGCSEGQQVSGQRNQ